MTFGPHGADKALHYTTFDGGGEVRRIAFTKGNRSPVAIAEGDPNKWSKNLTINLTGAKSSDPDGDLPLTYRWDFTSDGTVDATGATVAHTYPSPGKYTATLQVRDARGALSDPDTIEVFAGDTPPDPVIGSPAADTRFTVGQKITLSGSATDSCHHSPKLPKPMLLPGKRGESLVGQIGIVAVVANEKISDGSLVGGGLGQGEGGYDARRRDGQSHLEPVDPFGLRDAPPEGGLPTEQPLPASPHPHDRRDQGGVQDVG
jgi:PKD repeat protein